MKTVLSKSRPASLYSTDPKELFETLRTQNGCKGHSPATRAACALIIVSGAPHLQASQLSTLADQQLWEGAKAAHDQNPESLDTLPDGLLQSIAWGEAIALQWGLRYQTPDLPTGDNMLSLIDAISPGYGINIQALVYGAGLPPYCDVRWKERNFVEDPFKPTFKNLLCLPWWPEGFSH